MSPANEYKTLKEQLYKQTDMGNEQEEVCEYLDMIQHTEEELEALHELVYHMHTSKMTGEWEPFNKEIMIGGFDKGLEDEEYLRMMDRQEMLGDMYGFEDENKTHSVLANNPWSSRSSISGYDKLNKRSEMTMEGMVTHVGTNYSTATSEYGKIYIPRACGINLPIGKYTNKKITMRGRFQGFEGSRVSAMPWRCLALIGVDYN
jgi:hypothetical protein